MTGRAAILTAAITHAKRGWPVFPVHGVNPDGGCTCGDPECTDVGKHPTIPGGLTRAHTDSERISRWWSKHPHHNVAIRTGPESGLLVLDVEAEGAESVKGRHLPPTPVARTGGGGWHYLYRWPASLEGFTTTRSAVLPKVDTRGAGGYIVAPPSFHKSGRRYDWALGLSPDDVALADPPSWLIEALKDHRSGSRTPSTKWRNRAATPVPTGRRNDTLARLAGHCLRRLDPIVARELLLAWSQARCSPPMDPTEAERTINSIAQKELERRGGGRHG